MGDFAVLISMLDKHLQAVESKLDTLLKQVGYPPLADVRPTCKYLFFDWLEEWFVVFKSPTLKDKGYDLKNTINRHVKPNIENKPLNEYTPLDITKALNSVVSERMRQIVRQVYNQCFREAVQLGYIEKNPVEFVKYVKHTYKNGRTLENSEEIEFLRKAQTEVELYPLFVFYLLTGARPSEPMTIKWEDITNDKIRIRGTKTVKSDRYLPLSDMLRDLLAKIPRNSEYVFPYSMAKVRFAFERIREKLSFHMTIKDLRHTFGTRCLESGVSMKTVQKWMGHSKFDTTADIYSHITTEFEKVELSKLETQNSSIFHIVKK